MEFDLTIKVMIVDDHAVVCHGTKLLLEEDPQIQVVGLATDGQSAVELAKTVHPDVILMDINLPKINGIKTTSIIKKFDPEIKVIAFTGYDQEQYITALVHAGAHGFLPKTVSQDILIESIKKVFQGKYLNIQDSPGSSPQDPNAPPDCKIDLTTRELEILHLLAEGLGNKEISLRLALSIRTIEFHVGNILGKLRCQSRLSAVLEARRLGLIQDN